MDSLWWNNAISLSLCWYSWPWMKPPHTSFHTHLCHFTTSGVNCCLAVILLLLVSEASGAKLFSQRNSDDNGGGLDQVKRSNLWPQACNVLPGARTRWLKTPISCPPRLSASLQAETVWLTSLFFCFQTISLLLFFPLDYFQLFVFPLRFLCRKPWFSYLNYFLFCSFCSVFIILLRMRSVLPLFLFCSFPVLSVSSIHLSFLHSDRSHYTEIECRVMLPFFLSQNKINFSALHFPLLQSPDRHLIFFLFLFFFSRELLLNCTDRDRVEKNRRKRHIFLIKSTKVWWGGVGGGEGRGLSLHRRRSRFDH